jgi:hypothetical protein
MNRKIIENQFNKYLQVYHFTEADRPLLKNLKSFFHQEEVDLALCSEDFFNFLLNESNLEIETKTQIALKHQDLITNFPQKKEVLEESTITGIERVFDFYNQHLKNKTYNFQIQFFGKTLPVLASFEMISASRGTPRHIAINYKITVCGIFNETRSHKLFHREIKEARTKYKKMGFYELMREIGLYKLELNIIDYEQLLEKTDILMKQNGLQFLTNQKVLKYEFKNVFTWYLLSSSDSFSKVILESELEINQDRDHYYDRGNNGLIEKHTTPYVRIFSLSQKRYYFIHIDDLIPYQYDKESFSKLVIPEETRSLLSSVFQSNIKDYYGDFIKSKHGGMVVLAEGPTGVGKTSTAEVYAELLEKPLYMVQLDELGTDAKAIESNLSIIFKRIQKWNAVLLFDEIDVYLYRRENDLVQSAIVGVFLRLLDYFSGLIFFTTNRSSVLDPAILSRISLRIKYEKLNENTQLEVWKSKLQDAQVTIDSLQVLPKLDLNGRQIKNTIRVAKVVYGNRFNEKDLAHLIKKFII